MRERRTLLASVPSPGDGCVGKKAVIDIVPRGAFVGRMECFMVLNKAFQWLDTLGCSHEAR